MPSTGVRISSAAWRLSLVALTGLRLVMWALLLHNIPWTPDHYDRWHFHHGGDQGQFTQVANALLSGRPQLVNVGVGLPLLMAMPMKLLDTADYDTALPLIVIGNGLLFGMLSVSILASLAYAFTGSRAQALLVAAAWTLLPYLLWAGFGLHPMADILRNAYVPRQMWVTGISDGPSFLFVTLGMLLVFKGARRERSHDPAGAERRTGRPLRYRSGAGPLRLGSGAGWVVAGAVCLGFAAAIRIHTLAMSAMVVLGFLWLRQPRTVLWILIGLVIGFGPQFWYNAMADRHPFNTPYFRSWIYFTPDWHPLLRLTGAPFSPSFLVASLSALATRLPLLMLAGLVVAACAVVAFIRCWHARGSATAIAMFGAPAASFAIHAATFVYADDPVRFTLPAVSIGLPALVWTGFVVFDEITGRVRRAAAPAKS